MPSHVVLHVYDLSAGLAANLSKALIGKEVSAVYHTGVVVYDTEYFYGDGIATGYPANTPYGTPIRKDDMGETTKTIQEIRSWVDGQNVSEFTGAKYNPMAHNCNHFSNAFLQFLNGSAVPSEILEQPNEFLATPIGKMVSGMFGMNNNVNAVPQTQEKVDERYNQLYIEDPRVFVKDEATIIELIPRVSSDQAFVDQMNRVLTAYVDKKDFVVNRTIVGVLEKAEVSDELYDLLALLCCTSSVELIPAQLHPLRRLESSDESASLLAYVNNWFSAEIGMHDARKNAVEYAGHIRRLMRSENTGLQLNACRCYFTMSRCLTYRNIKETTPLPYLLGVYGEFLAERANNERHYLVCMNLVCGCIGRILLTIKRSDSTMFNQLRIEARQRLDLATLANTKAPCIHQLADFLGTTAPSEDDMF